MSGGPASPLPSSAASERYFPGAGDGWKTVDPADVKWDRRRLDDLLGFVEQTNGSGLIVLQSGRIMTERYWKGADLHSSGDIASAQKSMVSVMAGVAVGAGKLSLDAPASQYLGKAWTKARADQEERITVRHLLSMSSGLTDSLVVASEAGTLWYYNTPAYHTMKVVLERAVGKNITDYSRETLWGPLGMHDSSWQPRPNMLMPDGVTPMTGLVTSLRDMARFGLAVLAGGAWAGTDLVKDKTYLKASLNTSQPMNPSYGYLWWLNGKASYLLPGSGPSFPGPLIPNGPADMFMAMGAGEKRIYVVPSLDLVVARQGSPANSSGAAARSAFDTDLWARTMAAAPV